VRAGNADKGERTVSPVKYELEPWHDPADDPDLPALPPARVEVERFTTGARIIDVVYITFLFTPFVQAVMANLGGKLGDTLDASTRHLLHQLLRRTREPATGQRDPARTRTIEVYLQHELSGARIHLTDELPLEAVRQLAGLDFTAPVTADAYLSWKPPHDPHGQWVAYEIDPTQPSGRTRLATWAPHERQWNPE
jgi:hypothetical protein